MDATLQGLQPDDTLRVQVQAAAEILRKGGVVAIPTDTLYGLAASPFIPAAVERIFRIKGRPENAPIPLLIAASQDLHRYAVDVPEVAMALAEAFWPGGLTMVLARATSIPDAVSGGRDTVGLRVPDSVVARGLADELGSPITGTSANVSGTPGIATAEEVESELGSKVDMVIDGGAAPVGKASTVLDLSNERPRLLREGAVSKAEIEAVYGSYVPVLG